jgi:predicted nucleotidyltransferase
MKLILKVAVGSQAHGLAAPDSDRDYRAVEVMPTMQMFQVGFKFSSPRWTVGETDVTAWEVGEFLALAMHGHPLILETLLAPVVEHDQWGDELRTLFPALWAPEPTHAAFLQYAHNQRKKMLDRKDGRPEKYAAAYIRVLYNLCELLEHGTFAVRIIDTPMGDKVARLKRGEFRFGETIDVGESLEEQAAVHLAHCRHQPDLSRVNDYLLRVRKNFL